MVSWKKFYNIRFMNKEYRQCVRCVMDTTAKGIHFDENGICNYCTDYTKDKRIQQYDPQKLAVLVEEIKAAGKGNKYDCIVGVSGGVDSSWVLYQAIKLGLRPLAVHMDNGWNSELAQNNIANLIKASNVDLYTHVINWNEYKSLMQAFFDADVLDVELLYDNAMLAVNYKIASQYNIKYILAGTNMATEGMRMPSNWNWNKFDKRNIKAIAKRNKVKIETFPFIGTLEYVYYQHLKKIRWTSILDYIEYNKFDALNYLEANFNYKRYPYKHYESIFTRFYQGYILPNKFNIDKRKLHFSTLIMSNQIDRDVALKDLEKIPYNTAEDMEDDRQYFMKKMGWSQTEFDDYIARPEVSHEFYGSENGLWDKMSRYYYKYFKKQER